MCDAAPFIDAVFETPDNGINVVFKDADTSFVNALRRTLLLDVPSLGIDKVTMYKNSSCVPCDTICQRLAMVPLNSKHVFQASKLLLDVEGPCTVFSDHVETDLQSSKSPLKEGIVLFKLNENQRVKLSCTLKICTGNEHVRFNNVSKMTLKKMSDNSTMLSFCLNNDVSASSLFAAAIDVLSKRMSVVKDELDNF